MLKFAFMLSFSTSRIAENNLNGSILTDSPATCPSFITRFQAMIRIFVRGFIQFAIFYQETDSCSYIYCQKFSYSQYSSTIRTLILTLMNRKTLGEHMVVACAHSSLPPSR